MPACNTACLFGRLDYGRIDVQVQPLSYHVLCVNAPSKLEQR